MHFAAGAAILQARCKRYSMRVVIGVGSSTVRPTVHRRSCDFRTASGSTARALSTHASPAGNVTR